MVLACGFRSISCASDMIGSSVPPMVPERWRFLPSCSAMGECASSVTLPRNWARSLSWSPVTLRPASMTSACTSTTGFSSAERGRRWNRSAFSLGRYSLSIKSLLKRRMPPVGSLRRQHHFAVTGQFQPPGAVAIIQDVNPPDFDTIRADGDLRCAGKCHSPNAETRPCADKTTLPDCSSRNIRWAGRWPTRALHSRDPEDKSMCPTGPGWYRPASGSAQTRAIGCIRPRRW